MYISFDIGGTAVKYGIVDDAGKIIEKSKVPTPMEEEAFLSTLTDIVEDYQERFPGVRGIGVSAPGVVSADGVMTTFGALNQLYGMTLRAKLSDLTGLPVVVENDANSAAIAERWIGAAKGLSNYLTIVVGTGLGGGIILNGEVYRGAHGAAGELGWPLYHGVPRAGNIEQASENFHSPTVLGLLRSYNAALDSFGVHDEWTDAKALIDLVKSDDETAKAVFDDFVLDLATNIFNLFVIFDPEAILIGGGISENDFFMHSLKKTWKRLISRHKAANFVDSLGLIGELRKAQLGNDAGMLGAAYRIKTQLEKDRS